MKIPQIKLNANEIESALKIFYLRRDRSIALLSGQARKFAKLQKEHAKVCADNFELSKHVKFPAIDNVPVFSIYGFNIIKVSLCELFRPKSMKEIMYKKLLWSDKMKRNYAKAISTTLNNQH